MHVKVKLNTNKQYVNTIGLFEMAISGTMRQFFMSKTDGDWLIWVVGILKYK